MANAKMKGTFADLSGTEYGTGGGGASSQTFTINNASDTIPSNTTVVRLNSAIGFVSLNGTPVIQAGTTEGQRLITIIDDASTGGVQFAIVTDGGILPIASPTTLNAYGSYEEALEWVWVDGFWKTVSTPAQNPITVPVDADKITGTLNSNFTNTNALIKRLHVNLTPVGTGADTTEDDLMSFSLPGGTLSSDGMGIRVTAFGDGVNTADTMTVRLYFGATKVLEFLLVASTLNTWRATGEIMRIDGTNQIASAEYNASPFSGSPLIYTATTLPAETLSGAVTVRFTGQRDTSSVADSIRQLGLIIELIP